MKDNVALVPKEQDLKDFIHFLFEGLEGYAYVASKLKNHLPECTKHDCKCWSKAFFEYPGQVDFMVQGINKISPSEEIYLAPALYKGKGGAEKEDVKVTQVLWADFDGNTPDEFDIPPSLIVRSSEPGHEHTYWKLDNPLTDIDTIEDYNRRLCYKYDADNSAWNGNRVLRPPFTTNHKHSGLPVSILQQDTNLKFNLAVFDDLAAAPEKSVDYSLWTKIDLPSLNDVIYRNQFGPDFRLLFEKTKAEVTDRSASLTHMAYICAEAGLNDKDIYVIIEHLATRWEKFDHHTPDSRARQLIGIIEHTRIKYPHSHFDEFDQVFAFSPKTLFESDIQVEWVIPNMLLHRGIMMLAGPPGIGKSRLTLQFMAHLAMGKNFLDYEIEKPFKLGFFSLEMGDFELKNFLLSAYPQWLENCTPDEIDLLNQNLTLLPFGEALPLNTQAGQDVIVQYQEQYKWEGIFVDSVGKSIFGNISDNATVQPWNNFNDKMRKRYNVFMWYVHHFRKPASGTKLTGEQADLYGDQYIQANATSIYTLTRSKNGLTRMKNPKQRHAAEEETKLLANDGISFSFHGTENETPNPIDMVKKQLEASKQKLDEDDDPMPFA